jgi:hypothetical protein
MKSAELKELNYQFKTNINMKTKISILVLIKAFFILLVMCCFSSCNIDEGVKPKESGYKISGVINTIKVVEVDSCEYLYGDWGSATVLTHKGNCKYCAKRSLK